MCVCARGSLASTARKCKRLLANGSVARRGSRRFVAAPPDALALHGFDKVVRLLALQPKPGACMPAMCACRHLLRLLCSQSSHIQTGQAIPLAQASQRGATWQPLATVAARNMRARAHRIAGLLEEASRVVDCAAEARADGQQAAAGAGWAAGRAASVRSTGPGMVRAGTASHGHGGQGHTPSSDLTRQLIRSLPARAVTIVLWAPAQQAESAR